MPLPVLSLPRWLSVSFDVYGDGDAEIMEQFSGFNDVSSGYWAAEYIKYAALHGWD